jgi:putative membrane protein
VGYARQLLSSDLASPSSSFFERLKDMPGVGQARFPEAPRYLGLMLILCGIAALIVAIWEYRWMLRYMWGGDFKAIAGVASEAKQTPLLAVAIALVFVGIFAFRQCGFVLYEREFNTNTD